MTRQYYTNEYTQSRFKYGRSISCQRGVYIILGPMLYFSRYPAVDHSLAFCYEGGASWPSVV